MDLKSFAPAKQRRCSVASSSISGQSLQQGVTAAAYAPVRSLSCISQFCQGPHVAFLEHILVCVSAASSGSCNILCLACRRSHTSRWGGCAAHIVCASIWTLLRLQGFGCWSHRRHWSGHSEALGCRGRARESSCQGHQQSCESSPPLQPALHDFERCLSRAMLCSTNLLLCSGYLLGCVAGLFGKGLPGRCDVTGKFLACRHPCCHLRQSW